MESPTASTVDPSNLQPPASSSHHDKDNQISTRPTTSQTPVKEDLPAIPPPSTPPSQSQSQSQLPTSPTTILPIPAKDRDRCDNIPCFHQALIVCGICNDAPHYVTDPPTAQYCSISCQKADLARHIRVCDRMLDRTTLFRAMEVAMKQLYIYRELSWHAFDLTGLEGRIDDDGVETVVVQGWVSFSPSSSCLLFICSSLL
jgi:hypothetical protein